MLCGCNFNPVNCGIFLSHNKWGVLVTFSTLILYFMGGFQTTISMCSEWGKTKSFARSRCGLPNDILSKGKNMELSQRESQKNV